MITTKRMLKNTSYEKDKISNAYQILSTMCPKNVTPTKIEI